MNTREIITLQIGHYANFVGTHWWNIQESSFCYDASKSSDIQINHDILFREGMNPRGEVTYTPRLIAVDLKGSLKTLKQEGTLYSIDQTVPRVSSAWSGRVDVFKTEPERKNEYLQDLDKIEHSQNSKSDLKYCYDEDRDICHDDQISPMQSNKNLVATSPLIEDRFYDLDSKVKVWSDFLRPHLHPKSVITLEDYFHNNEQEPFDLFGTGVEAYHTETTKDNIEECCRKFAEECHFFQGFQMILNGCDAFAGLASSIMNHFDDEYSSKGRICFPVFQPTYSGKTDTIRASEAHRLLSAIFCLDSLCNNSSLFSPLNMGKGTIGSDQDVINLPHLNYNKSLPYHTSSILAIALESLTSPLRLKHEPTSLNDLINQLTPCGRKLLSTSVCLPFPWHEGEFLSDILSQRQIDSYLIPITPLTSSSVSTIVQNIVLSGFPKNQLYSKKLSHSQRISVEELLAKNLHSISFSRSCYIKMLAAPCKVVNPFPSIFTNNVNYDGSINELERPKFTGVKEVPILSGLRNSNSCSNIVRHFVSLGSSTNFKKYHRCFESGIEADDIDEIVNNLQCFGENYD